jgi:elongation factor Ts
MFCLYFIVREFDLIFCGLLIMQVARIATSEMLELVDKDKVTLSGNVKDFASNFDFFRIERVCLVKFDLVERLRSRAESLVYLPGFASTSRTR